jgi:hypothetical protein
MADYSEEQAARAKALMHGLEYVPPWLIDTGRNLASLLPNAVWT